MKNSRKIYEGNFKARVVLEVIRGEKTTSWNCKWISGSS